MLLRICQNVHGFTPYARKEVLTTLGGRGLLHSGSDMLEKFGRELILEVLQLSSTTALGSCTKNP